MTRDWARLGAAIRDAYRQLGLTQRQVSDASGVSRSTLSRLESGSGPEPTATTLTRVEKAIGWPAGTAVAIAEGGEIPQPGPVREITVRKPAALSDPELLAQVPEQIRDELARTGQVLGVDVIDLGPSEAGARMIVVLKRDADAPEPDPEALRAAMEEWQRKRKALWQPPPNT